MLQHTEILDGVKLVKRLICFQLICKITLCNYLITKDLLAIIFRTKSNICDGDFVQKYVAT